MIECIFTIDYEIYGNGEGSLNELVFEPARHLKNIFDAAQAKFVVFVEIAELQQLDRARTDAAIDDVKRQIREFYEDGYEIALHLHPQWCNARYVGEKWNLDYSEYNLCTLSEQRIDEIVASAIDYLREVLDEPTFTPTSFRAGNWLFQPTSPAAGVLAKHGRRLDSSVFKGGRQRKHGLDYRAAVRNGYFWKFCDDVNVPDREGSLLEIPVYSTLVPPWKMATAKRIGLHKNAAPQRARGRDKFYRLLDLMRFRHPLKFDFCRMTAGELKEMIRNVIREDHGNREIYRPVVAIGHT